MHKIGITIKTVVPNQGVILFALPRGHLARSGDIFSCHSWKGGAIDIY